MRGDDVIGAGSLDIRDGPMDDLRLCPDEMESSHDRVDLFRSGDSLACFTAFTMPGGRILKPRPDLCP